MLAFGKIPLLGGLLIDGLLRLYTLLYNALAHSSYRERRRI